MTAFLWTMVALGVGEVVTTSYYALKNKVPPRTAGSMAFNVAVMMGLGMWAFWLLATSS